MKKVKIGYEDVSQFGIFLAGEERSAATVEKYRRDAGAFVDFLGSREISRQIVLDYKKQLSGRYAPSSANSMIAALNSFLRFCGQGELCVKRLRVQRAAFCSEKKELTREEYCRLVRTAEKNGNDRLGLYAIYVSLGKISINYHIFVIKTETHLDIWTKYMYNGHNVV